MIKVCVGKDKSAVWRMDGDMSERWSSQPVGKEKEAQS